MTLFDLVHTHLVDDGADRTRCGIRLHNHRGRSPYPYVLARHAQLHVDKRGMAICPECEEARG